MRGIRSELQKALASTVLALLASLLLASVACAEAARVQVATVDGAPVYHWQTLKSQMSSDVDRALVLREFQRKKFQVPPKLVDDQVRQIVDKKFGGNDEKFARNLRNQGLTLQDFKQFTREEIILSAMLYQKVKPSDSAKATENWLAGLRAHAVVKPLSPEAKHQN